MPIFKIEPIQTITLGGFKATITGINTGSTDYITGTIHGTNKETNVSWNASGLCRDNIPDCNLDTKSNQFIEIVEAAKVFLPK